MLRRSSLPFERLRNSGTPESLLAALADRAANYDISDPNSLIRDASDNVLLISDKSGNSGTGSGTSTALILPGVNGSYASTPSSAALNAITSEVEFIVRVKSNDWTSTTGGAMVGKYDTGASKRQYAFYSNTTTPNRLRLAVSSNGGTPSTIDSNADNPFGSSALVWLKANIVGNEGGVTKGRFYYSLDTTSDPTSVSWTQIGTAANATLYYPTWNTDDAPLEIGSVSLGTVLPFNGNIYRAIVKDGIDGSTVFDANFVGRRTNATSFTEDSVNAATVTINGSAQLGWVDSGNCLVLPGVAGNYASSTKYVPPAGVVMRVEVKINADSYTPAQNGYFYAVWNGATQRAWATGITATTGTARLILTSDGTSGTTQTIVSTEAIPAGTEYIAYIVDSTGGVIDFEISVDGTSWSALGSQVGITAVTIYQSSTSGLEIGSLDGGTTAAYEGKIYTAKIYADGVLVRNFDATAQPKLATSWVSTTGETWTVSTTAIALPARIHGARDLYMDTSGSQPKYLPWEGSNYGYIGGVASRSFSTPSVAANQPSTEIEIVARVNKDNYTTVSRYCSILAKYNSAGGRRAYEMSFFDSNIYLWLGPASGSGSTSVTASYNTAGLFTNRETYWLKGTWSATDNRAYFFYQVDTGNNVAPTSGWITINGGGTSMSSSCASIYNNTVDPLRVGNKQDDTNYWDGSIYYAHIALTVGGSAGSVFNASNYPSTGGSTFDDGVPETTIISQPGMNQSSGRPLNVFTSLGGGSYYYEESGGQDARFGTTSLAAGLFKLGRRYRFTVVASGLVGNRPGLSSRDGPSPDTAGGTLLLAQNTLVEGTNTWVITANAVLAADRNICFDFSSGSIGSGTIETFTVEELPELWTINGGAKIVTRTGLYHDGSNDYMKTAPFALSQPENVYFVGEQVTWTANDKLYDGSGVANRMFLGQRNTGSTPEIETNAGSSGPQVSPALKVGAVLFALFNTTSSLLRINRNTSATGDAGTQAGKGLTLSGPYDGSTAFANTFVHEILITDTVAHDTATQDRIILALGRKWRINV